MKIKPDSEIKLKITLFLFFCCLLTNHIEAQNVYYGLLLHTHGGKPSNNEINFTTTNSGTELSFNANDMQYDYFCYDFGIAKMKNLKHYFFYIFKPGASYNTAQIQAESNPLGYEIFEVSYWNINTSLRVGKHIYKGKGGFTFYLSGGLNVESNPFSIKETASNSFVDDDPHKLDGEFQGILYPISWSYDYFIDIGFYWRNMFISYYQPIGQSNPEFIFQKDWGLTVGVFFNPYKEYKKYKIYTK